MRSNNLILFDSVKEEMPDPDINWKLVSEEIEDDFRIEKKNNRPLVFIEDISSNDPNPLEVLIQKETESLRTKKTNNELTISPFAKIENLPNHESMRKSKDLSRRH